MKSLVGLLTLIGLATILLGFGAVAPAKPPRLSEVSKFPKEYAPALKAVLAAVTKEGMELRPAFSVHERRLVRTLRVARR